MTISHDIKKGHKVKGNQKGGEENVRRTWQKDVLAKKYLYVVEGTYELFSSLPLPCVSITWHLHFKA